MTECYENPLRTIKVQSVVVGDAVLNEFILKSILRRLTALESGSGGGGDASLLARIVALEQFKNLITSGLYP